MMVAAAMAAGLSKDEAMALMPGNGNDPTVQPGASASAGGPAPATASWPDSEPLLRLRGISKHFGAVQALYGVDLDLPAGSVTALAGDNGAGKSVLTKTIAGIHESDEGEILWNGRPVHIRSPKDSAALGIETVYQDLALADNLDIRLRAQHGLDPFSKQGVVVADQDRDLLFHTPGYTCPPGSGRSISILVPCTLAAGLAGLD